MQSCGSGGGEATKKQEAGDGLLLGAREGVKAAAKETAVMGR
jgi:hypothetical protein